MEPIHPLFTIPIQAFHTSVGGYRTRKLCSFYRLTSTEVSLGCRRSIPPPICQFLDICPSSRKSVLHFFMKRNFTLLPFLLSLGTHVIAPLTPSFFSVIGNFALTFRQSYQIVLPSYSPPLLAEEFASKLSRLPHPSLWPHGTESMARVVPPSLSLRCKPNH